MRIFFALLFDNNIKNHLSREIYLLHKNSIDGRFTDKNNLHLTLEFIGDTSTEQLNDLKRILHSIKCDEFEVQSTGLGSFYNKASKAILYLGIKPTNTLMELDALLRRLLIENGFTVQDKPYIPHVTLARKVEFKEQFLLKTFEFPTMMMKFTRLSLMQSLSEENALVYKEIDHVNLI